MPTANANADRDKNAIELAAKQVVIIKQGQRITWQNAELKALIFQAAAALLPKCQRQLAKVLLAWLQGGPGQEPCFPASVVTEIAQVGFDFILSFILPALTYALIN